MNTEAILQWSQFQLSYLRLVPWHILRNQIRHYLGPLPILGKKYSTDDFAIKLKGSFSHLGAADLEKG